MDRFQYIYIFPSGIFLDYLNTVYLKRVLLLDVLHFLPAILSLPTCPTRDCKEQIDPQKNNN